MFGDAGAEKHWQSTMRFSFSNVGDVWRFACSTTGHDDAFSAHEFNRFSGLTKVDISCDCMCRVLLLHVRPHLHALGANQLAITQQLCRRRLDESLIRNVCVGITLSANEVKTGSMGHRHRLNIRAR